MKKYIFALIVIFTLNACKKQEYKNISASKEIKNLLIKNATILTQQLTTLEQLSQSDVSSRKLQSQFKKARITYKKIESITAYYFPETAENMNGAAIDKNDVMDSNRRLEEASGFQKIEELIFNRPINFKETQLQINILLGYTHALQSKINNLDLSDSNIFEAQKLNLIRIMSLGITGFDSPIANNTILETQSAMASVFETLLFYKNHPNTEQLSEKTTAYLFKHQNFNHFDRAFFIKEYCIPLYKQIHALQKELKIENNPFTTAIDLTKSSPFEENAFNANYFAPHYNRTPSKAQIDLGKSLFNDPILSGDNTVACTTCHLPELGYADHKAKAVSNLNNARNTPTLLNAALQNNLFWDSRVTYLEDQAKAVINNKNEMHGSFSTALKKLNSHKIYLKKFKETFPNANTITEQNLLMSLASYIRTLSPMNSKFDQYLRNKAVLSSKEKNGFNVFMGKGKCATCHFFPLFNGSVPPLYNKTESEVLGVPSYLTSKNIDGDLGEYLINRAPLKKFAFKTPTVRNSTLTFPYMHHGGLRNLEDVIDFYNKGGGKGMGMAISHQTLPSDPLKLTTKEKSDLIAFLTTLTDQY